MPIYAHTQELLTLSDYLDKVLAGTGGVRDSVLCQRYSLIGHWNRQDFDLHRLRPGGGEGGGFKVSAAPDLFVLGH